jgi:hypothetical protein
MRKLLARWRRGDWVDWTAGGRSLAMSVAIEEIMDKELREHGTPTSLGEVVYGVSPNPDPQESV